MNLITLADARTFLKPYVGGGTCSTSRIDADIAEIEERLLPEADPSTSLRRVRVLVRNRQFSLPINVLRIIAVNVDGYAAALGSQAVEFSSAYAGDIDMIGQTSRNVIDAGEHPTQYDIPVQRVSDTAWSSGLKLVAFSTSADDAVLNLTIRGYGANGDEIRTVQDGVLAPGETLRVNRWHLGVEGQILNMASQAMTTNLYTSVGRVYKPASSAAVSLYAYDSATGAMYFLSKMEPDVTVPSYRRYRLTGMDEPVVNADKEIETDCASVLMLVKIGWVRATRPTDILTIQNLSALKFGAMALVAENAGSYDASLAAWAQAIRIIKNQQADRDGNVSIPSIIDVDVNLSLRPLNHGYLV